MYKTKDIANYIIDFTIKQEKPITNLKLQKMLYFIQGFSYAKTNQPFIDAEFEVWPYGPTIRDLYIDYSVYGSFTIDKIENLNPKEHIISQNDKEFLNKVIEKLNKYSDNQLVNISKAGDSPYTETYQKEGLKGIIDNKLISNYFRHNIKEQTV